MYMTDKRGPLCRWAFACLAMLSLVFTTSLFSAPPPLPNPGMLLGTWNFNARFRFHNMKISRLAVWVLIGIAVATLVALFWRSHSDIRPGKTVSGSASNLLSEPAASQHLSNPAQPKAGNPAPSQIRTPEEYVAHMNRVFDAQKTRIEFWGRVVDHEMQPIAGAQVAAAVNWVIAEPDNFKDKFERYDLTTDANGDFKVRGAIGTSLEVKGITKAGYLLTANNQRQFFYSGVIASRRILLSQ
jgi:hypothetical protein